MEIQQFRRKGVAVRVNHRNDSERARNYFVNLRKKTVMIFVNLKCDVLDASNVYMSSK